MERLLGHQGAVLTASALAFEFCADCGVWAGRFAVSTIGVEEEGVEFRGDQIDDQSKLSPSNYLTGSAR